MLSDRFMVSVMYFGVVSSASWYIIPCAFNVVILKAWQLIINKNKN